MPANASVTETRISAGELVLGPAVDGYRYGTVTVTVAHRWGSRPHGLTLYFYVPAGLERAGSAWPTAIEGADMFRITVDPPAAARTSRTLRFSFRRLATLTGGALTVELSGTNSSGATVSEAIQFNNGATTASVQRAEVHPGAVP
jgi:hypothetical protein